GRSSGEVVDALLVTQITARPFHHERAQGLLVGGRNGIETGVTGDQDVVGLAAGERVRAVAADQEIAATAAGKRVGAVATNQNIRTGAAGDLVVAAVAVQDRGQRNLAIDGDSVVAPLPVDDDVTRGEEGSLRDVVDQHLNAAGIGGLAGLELNRVVDRAATHEQGRLAGVGRIGQNLRALDGNGR